MLAITYIGLSAYAVWGCHDGEQEAYALDFAMGIKCCCFLSEGVNRMSGE